MAKGLSLTEIWDLSATVSRASEHPLPPLLQRRCCLSELPHSYGQCLLRWPAVSSGMSVSGLCCLLQGHCQTKANRNSWCNTCILHGSGGQSSLWAHEQCVCPFNIVFAINEAIGNIYGALLGSCSVSSWLKPSPCVQLAQSPSVPRVQELIGTGEGRELRADKQALFVSPWLLPRNWKDTSAH